MLDYVYFLTSHLAFVTAIITLHYRMLCKPLQMKPDKLFCDSHPRCDWDVCMLNIKLLSLISQSFFQPQSHKSLSLCFTLFLPLLSPTVVKTVSYSCNLVWIFEGPLITLFQIVTWSLNHHFQKHWSKALNSFWVSWIFLTASKVCEHTCWHVSLQFSLLPSWALLK